MSLFSPSDLSIRQKGLLFIIAPFLVQLLLLGILFVLRSNLSGAQEWTNDTYRMISLAHELRHLILESQGASRGFILTSHPDLLQKRESSLAEAKTLFQKLHNLSIENQEQRQRLDKLGEQLENLQGWYRELDDLILRDRSNEIKDKMQTLPNEGSVELAQRILTEVIENQHSLLKARLGGIWKDIDKLYYLIFAGSIFSVLIVLALGAVFHSSIMRRLSIILENIDRFRNQHPLLPRLRGKDELQLIDGAFHSLGRTLNDRRSENEMFMYSVSHDLRSPLVNLRGFSDELKFAIQELDTIVTKEDLSQTSRDKVRGLIDKNIERSINHIKNAVDRLSKIIDSLLRLSRIGRVEYKKQDVDMTSIINQVVASSSAVQKEKDVEVIVEGPLPKAFVDPEAATRVFANLLDNSIKYLDPQRKGVIEIGTVVPHRSSTESNESSSKSKKSDRFITFFIRDNGSGMTPESLSKLFLIFQRFHPHLAEGEGIGLAIIRKIIDNNGGRISVESEKDKGTTFYVSFLKAGSREAFP